MNRPIEHKLGAIAEEIQEMKRRRQSLEEQSFLRDQINEQQKTLAEMRQHRQNSEKKSADEREQAVELKKGKWFGGGDRIPETEDMLDPRKLGEMLKELDLEFRKR